MTFAARRWATWLVVTTGMLTIEACSSSGPPPSAVQLTYNRDVAPILWRRCGACHRPGQMAPFSLLEYADVQRRAGAIAAAVERRMMPPWLPETGNLEFANDRRLTSNEIRTVVQWVKEGAVEGSVEERQQQPHWPDDWVLGTPDVVVSLPEPYMLKPGARDEFRNFVLPIPVNSTKYVRGIEVRPGNAHVVHHATIGIDRSQASRMLDAGDPEPGYSGMFSEGAHSPGNHALGWTPGMTPRLEPPETAWRLDAGSDLIIQLHMMPSHLHEPQSVRPSVALYFSSIAPTAETIDFKLGSKTIDIPAGESHYVVTDTYRLPVAVSLLSIYPHAHYLATEMKAFATLPDGTRQSLLWIRKWNFNWQDQYEYVEPVPLPAGTTLAMEFTYDNSGSNPLNPHAPPVRVSYGPQSTDEMGDLWLRLLPHSRADAAVIGRAFLENEARKDLEAAERAVAAHPDDGKRLGVLGARYVEAGRSGDGIVYLQRARKLLPRDAEIRNDLGLAFREQGRLDDALVELREAVRLQPRNARIRSSLAEVLQDRGDVNGAIEHLRAALDLEPSVAETHNNLGVALGARGDLAGATREFRRALEIRPDYPDARENLDLATRTSRGP